MAFAYVCHALLNTEQLDWRTEVYISIAAQYLKHSHTTQMIKPPQSTAAALHLSQTNKHAYRWITQSHVKTCTKQNVQKLQKSSYPFMECCVITTFLTNLCIYVSNGLEELGTYLKRVLVQTQ